MASITIIGPGAIGGTVAAWLAQDKANEISLCVRTPFARLSVETPDGRLEATPRLFTSPQEPVVADWVLIATKTYDVTGTAAWFPKLIGPQTRVAILQNGVEHIERFSPYMDPGRLVPVVVDLPAERKEPGCIRQRGKGFFFVPHGDNGRDFVRLFAHTPIMVNTITDFRSRAWRKLALNATGAVSAVLLKSVDITRHPEIEELYRQLIRECVRVGRAEGAVLEETLEDEIIAGSRKSPADSINSLHADRLAGRPMEIDARNGAIVRFGRRHGIETPMNRLMVALLKAG
ncbi:MAG TPA: 2-dehydropantoate 2-reductase [Puia sp.]|nr:2-dehydropantoate 2-reductase [Puia sp.]